MFFTKLIKNLVQSGEIPDGELSPRLKAKVAKFASEKHDEAESFDFLAGLAEEPATEISSFVRKYCDVKRYYTRPPSVQVHEAESHLTTMKKTK